MTKEDILNTIIEAVKDLNQELNIQQFYSPSPSTLLYGSQGNLDSIGLVRLISEIESLISDRFDKNIILADERAMSRNKSPFRTIGVLADYIVELLGNGDSS